MPTFKQKSQKEKNPRRGHQQKKNQAGTDGPKAFGQKTSLEWRVVNLNPFGLSSTINFGSNLTDMPILRMGFKGFCARRSDEANPMPMEKPVFAVAED